MSIALYALKVLNVFHIGCGNVCLPRNHLTIYIIGRLRPMQLFCHFSVRSITTHATIIQLLYMNDRNPRSLSPVCLGAWLFVCSLLLYADSQYFMFVALIL